MMNDIPSINLRTCYDGLRELIGPNIEPFDIVEAVDDYRRYWKPKKNVRVILLAESHVYTTQEEFLSELNHADFNLIDHPKNFVRFVYCLGYGENGLLNQPINENPGSKGFWKIFFATTNPVTTHDDFSPIMKTRSFHDALLNKLKLLYEMREKGIWLLDASIVGINGTHRPSGRIYKRVLLHCWDCYIQQIITMSSPEQVVIIGKKVGDILEKKVTEVIGRSPIVVFQPNAHIKREQRFQDFRALYEACDGPSCETQSSQKFIKPNSIPSKDKSQMTNISGPTIRAKALEWARIKFGQTPEPAYCSKYYKPHESRTKKKAWWIQIPVKSIAKNGHICLLLEEYPNSDGFYCLNIPTSYLKDNDTGLTKLGININLFLSAEDGRMFQDQRGPGGIRFGQFIV